MLSHEENSGLGAFLIGMIVLVMSAVALSLLVDRRFNFSSSQSELERQLASGERSTETLRAELEHRNGLLAANAERHAIAERAIALRAEVAAGSGRVAGLTAERDVLQKEVESIEKRFAEHRSSYRRQAWRTAEGETVGQLQTRGGRVYHDVTIKRVTPVGVEISHASGIARIGAPELPASWHERFQWDDEERREKLRQEHAHRERMSGTGSETVDAQPVIAVSKADARRAARQEELARVNAAREEVRTWRSRVATLRREYRTAENNARYGRNVSVPGKLETWSARAARLRADLQRANNSLAAARAKLSAASPGDPLVSADPEE